MPRRSPGSTRASVSPRESLQRNVAQTQRDLHDYGAAYGRTTSCSRCTAPRLKAEDRARPESARGLSTLTGEIAVFISVCPAPSSSSTTRAQRPPLSTRANIGARTRWRSAPGYRTFEQQADIKGRDKGRRGQPAREGRGRAAAARVPRRCPRPRRSGLRRSRRRSTSRSGRASASASSSRACSPPHPRLRVRTVTSTEKRPRHRLPASTAAAWASTWAVVRPPRHRGLPHGRLTTPPSKPI